MALNNENTQIEYLAEPSIAACFDSIAQGRCDYSLVPFENSTNGQVVLSYDLFRNWFVMTSQLPDFHVVAEQFVPIHHNLISYGEDLTQIDQIYSHPQVWSQCTNYIKQLEQNAANKVDKLDVSSTSKAVQMLTKLGSQEERMHTAAIASSTASEIHGVPVQCSQIEDMAGNTTRFLVLGRQPVVSQDDSPRQMTLLAFMIKENDNFGTLCDILEAFKKNNLNLQTITTRPSVQSPWHYVFFVEVWNDTEEALEKALEQLRPLTLDLARIGTFFRATKFFSMLGNEASLDSPAGQ